MHKKTSTQSSTGKKLTAKKHHRDGEENKKNERI